MGKIFDQWTLGEVNTFSVFPTTIQDLFPDSSDGKESACNAGDMGSIWVGKIPRGGGHSNPLQCLCLENSMVRGVGVVQSVGSQRIADD